MGEDRMCVCVCVLEKRVGERSRKGIIHEKSPRGGVNR